MSNTTTAATADDTTGLSLAQVARLFDMQPHEVAAFLDLGSNWEMDYAISQLELAALEVSGDLY